MDLTNDTKTVFMREDSRVKTYRLEILDRSGYFNVRMVFHLIIFGILLLRMLLKRKSLKEMFPRRWIDSFFAVCSLWYLVFAGSCLALVLANPNMKDKAFGFLITIDVFGGLVWLKLYLIYTSHVLDHDRIIETNNNIEVI